jgi:DNA-directed RNA polymerase specialized sigma24 family protein
MRNLSAGPWPAMVRHSHNLIGRYQRTIHGYLVRRAGASAAQDLLAEVWMAAFR